MIYKAESYKIIGACMEVHNELGHGFHEEVYQEALAREFERQKIPFVAEKKLEIFYKGELLDKYYRADFICFDKIIIELKALPEITSKEIGQVLNYLKVTGFHLGLLVNFGKESFDYKRLVK